jgi:NAD(P)H-dependent FMN reductase
VKLTVFNGSPRGKSGNTAVFLKHLTDGFASSGEHTYETFYLRRVKETAQFVQAFGEAEAVLLAFPLYTDAMPGMVKAFIEALAPFRGRENNPAIGFLVQSGFPEATHSRYVERYLEKLASRLGCRYMGTVVKGNGEGARWLPEGHKLFLSLQEIGRALAEQGAFDEELLRGLAKPERFPTFLAPVFKVLLKTKLSTGGWDNQLKNNKAYEQRFARPYVQGG